MSKQKKFKLDFILPNGEFLTYYLSERAWNAKLVVNNHMAFEDEYGLSVMVDLGKIVIYQIGEYRDDATI